jgi:hypothetical protein
MAEGSAAGKRLRDSQCWNQEEEVSGWDAGGGKDGWQYGVADSAVWRVG